MDHENIRLMKRVERLESQVAELLERREFVMPVLTPDYMERMVQATGGTTQPEKRGRGRPRKS